MASTDTNTEVQKLPNELLASIVSFLDDQITQYPSLLLVSRWWYQLGNAHLYHSVIVSSEETADLLLRTLHMRPDLARHVKRLRLGGLLGGRSSEILKTIPPDLVHLCLSWSISPGEDVKPLASILQDLRPRRVSLYKGVGQRAAVSSESLELAVSLCSCITGSWMTLVSSRLSPLSSLTQLHIQEEFDFPYDFTMLQPEFKFLLMMYHARPITEALRKSSSLRIFRIPRAEAGFLIVQIVSRNPILQEIRSMRPLVQDRDSTRFFELYGEDEEITRRLIFPDTSERVAS